GAGAGHGARAGDRARHRRRPRRAHRGDDEAGRGRGLPGGPPRVSAKGARVLIADDERPLRELIVRELARKGHETEGVEDGQAAIDRLNETTFDVLVLDMRMPFKSGLDVLREMAGAPDAPRIIVMTGVKDVARRDE